MKIGIASPIDIRTFFSYFSEPNSLEYIKTSYIPSPASAVSTLILSLLKMGHYVRLFTLCTNSFIIKGEGIDIYGVKAVGGYPIKYLWGDFINAKNIRTVISTHLYDLEVLHAHWTYSYAYAVTSFTNQLPVFCTVRDWASYIWKIESFKNKITWSFRRLMNECVFKNRNIHFIANSPYTAALIKKKYKLDAPIIANPIKESFLKTEENVPQSSLNILCISSSNDRRKNIKILLAAFKQLLTKYPDAQLLLIGAPFVLGSSVVQRWKEEGLLDRVSLIGSVDHDELKSYFDQVCVFVTPSLEETFGNTLLEAMARKVPIIGGKNSGAVPYVLQGGKAGFLCDVSVSDELVNTIMYVYEHYEEAHQKALNAYRTLQKKYVSEEIAAQHIFLYKSYI